MSVRRAALLLLGAGLGSRPAGAHHDTATARVATGGGVGDALGLPLSAARPRLELGLSPAVASFARAREGTVAYTARPLGTITVGTLSSSAAVVLPTATRVGLSLPVGALWVEDPAGAATRHLGPGDLRLDLAQGLAPLWQGRGPLTVQLRAAGIAPTGSYDPDAGVSVTEVQGAEDGGIMLMTYDTQASLGSGAWAVGGGLALGLSLGGRLGLEAATTWTTSLSQTPDDIAWGDDLIGSVGAGVALIPGRLQVQAGGEVLRHGQDEVPGVEETTGDPVRSEVGGRTEVVLTGGVQARLAPDLRCGLHGRLPIWQRVGGVQLVESFGAGARCTVAVGRAPAEQRPGDSSPGDSSPGD